MGNKAQGLEVKLGAVRRGLSLEQKTVSPCTKLRVAKGGRVSRSPNKQVRTLLVHGRSLEPSVAAGSQTLSFIFLSHMNIRQVRQVRLLT